MTVREFPCAVDDCDWVLHEAFGDVAAPAPFVAVPYKVRVEMAQQELCVHLATHSAEELAGTVVRLQESLQFADAHVPEWERVIGEHKNEIARLRLLLARRDEQAGPNLWFTKPGAEFPIEQHEREERQLVDAFREDMARHVLDAPTVRTPGEPRVWREGDLEPVESGLILKSSDGVTWWRKGNGEWRGSAGYSMSTWVGLMCHKIRLTEHCSLGPEAGP